ncbi:galanin receptor 2a-like [Lytechinus pictus]|uniref:galanin receptor 2a-like n=1 Tax=Lytechinus pictus TaxID=7653 RepID=UPI0030B9F3FC
MNNLSVSSTVSTPEGLRPLSYLSTTIVYVLFGVFGIIGNGLVLLVIARVDDLQSVTNLFIANQSLIDLCTSVILIATYVLPLPSLPKDRPGLATFICRYWYSRYPFWSLIVASSLNLVLMTLERFCAVFYPIRFRQHTNYKLLKFIALFPWAIGFLFQLSSGYFASFDGNDCILSFFSNPAFKNIFQPAAISLEFILPVFAMVVVYTAIFIRLRNDGMRAFNHSTRSGIKANSKAANQQPRIADYRSRARINTIKTLLIVSAFFILCWSTNMILFFIFSCCGGGVDLNSLLYKISVFLGFGNMWINPFIYSFQYRWFQKGLRRVFCKGNRKSNTEAVQTISKARNQTSETVSL